jgi:hypothetical protein
LILAGCGGGGTPNPTATPTPTPAFSGISGVISSAANSAPLAGVIVITEPATTTVLTNASGIYTINDVNPGSYIVTASIKWLSRD